MLSLPNIGTNTHTRCCISTISYRRGLTEEWLGGVFMNESFSAGRVLFRQYIKPLWSTASYKDARIRSSLEYIVQPASRRQQSMSVYRHVPRSGREHKIFKHLQQVFFFLWGGWGQIGMRCPHKERPSYKFNVYMNEHRKPTHSASHSTQSSHTLDRWGEWGADIYF